MGKSLRLRDLGVLTGEVLVFGGPYSNLQATEALIEAAKALGIPAGNCICTGDVVAYCADAVATISVVRRFGCPVVAGNCEHQLAAGADDCGCGFEAGTVCDTLSAGWYAHADARVSAPDRRWMGGLPDVIAFHHGGRRCAVIHGGASDVARFVWPNTVASVYVEEISIINELCGDIDVVFAGRSGLAYARDVDDVAWVNAGVIGMPPHDGRTESRFAVLTEAGGVTFERLTYDHQAAVRAMVNAGLTQGYHKSLSTGIWPSEDMLPPELRR